MPAAEFTPDEADFLIACINDRVKSGLPGGVPAMIKFAPLAARLVAIAEEKTVVSVTGNATIKAPPGSIRRKNGRFAKIERTP